MQIKEILPRYSELTVWKAKNKTWDALSSGVNLTPRVTSDNSRRTSQLVDPAGKNNIDGIS